MEAALPLETTCMYPNTGVIGKITHDNSSSTNIKLVLVVVMIIMTITVTIIRKLISEISET